MTTDIPRFDDLLEQADELASKIAARTAALRGEVPAQEGAHELDNGNPGRERRTPDDPARIIRGAIEAVRSRRHNAGHDLAQLEAGLAGNTMYSAEDKREQAENFRAIQQAEAESVAALAWQRVTALEADLAAQHAEAERHVDARIDHARVAGIVRDLEARLALGAAPAGMDGRADQVALAEKLIEEAEVSGDPDRLRATRQVLSSTVGALASGMGEGTTDMQARDLRRRLRDLEGAERAEAEQIAQVRKAVAARKTELAQEIAELERVVTGAKRTIFSGMTAWDKRVFGKAS